MKKYLLWIIDVFYFLFKRILPLRTYRYMVCGGANLVLDTILYFISFHYIFKKENADLGPIVLSSHIASLFLVFPITFIIGFLLNRYIVFPESNLSAKIQFTRYFISGISALLISYLCMKLLVDVMNIYPTPSRLFTIIITVTFSYFMQRNFSFKTSSENHTF